MENPVRGVWIVLAGFALASFQYFYLQIGFFTPIGLSIYGVAAMLVIIGILNWNVR